MAKPVVDVKTLREVNGKKAFNSVIGMAQLLQTEMEPMKWTVDGLLCEGATLLAADPKAGKSWMALDLGIRVSQGEKFLGDFECVKGEVLYLALEDGPRRVKDRLAKLEKESGRQLEGYDVFFEWPPLIEGGIEGIEMWLRSKGNPRLVIIDTLKQVRVHRKANEGIYDYDYDAVNPINKLSQEWGISTLILHHTSKPPADDPFKTISGSLSLVGAVDSTMVLRVERELGRATLHVTGRDLETTSYELAFQPASFRWLSLDPVKRASVTGIKKDILEFLEREGQPVPPGEIAEKVGKSRRYVTSLLGELEEAGLVKSEGTTSDKVYWLTEGKS